MGGQIMKRYIISFVLLLTAFCASCVEAHAQEVRLGWSGYPTMDYENFTMYTSDFYYSDSPIQQMFSDKDGPTYMTGNIMASIDFERKKWFSFSIGLAANGVWKDKYDYRTGLKTHRENGCIVTVLPQARFNWLNREAVRMYSAIGVGVTAGAFDDKADCYLAGQITFLGVSVGRRLIGFAELGSGSMYMGGMVGIGYRF